MEAHILVSGLGLVTPGGDHFTPRNQREEDAYYARYSSAFALPAWLTATIGMARQLFAHRPRHHDVTTSRPHAA